jgi:hypothetical protein
MNHPEMSKTTPPKGATMTYTDNSPADCCIARNPQVPDQLSGLHQAIDSLNSRLDQLGDRIKPVLGSQTPTACGIGKEPELVELANVIRSERDRVYSASERIGEWLNRIEL